MLTPPYRYRVAIFLAILLTFALSGLALAEPSPAFVKEELVQSKKIWPGQRLTLYIKLYTTTSFSGSTRFELPQVSGMLTMENEDHPLVGTEEVEGLPYIFKRHEIDLFPLRSGRLTLPAFTVVFGFRGENGKLVEQSFSTQPLQFKVLEIPGAASQKPIITTVNLQVKDQWIPEPGIAKVGDALTRTITMTADDLPGMAFPPLALKKIDGLGFYTKPPQVQDQRQRGQFTGSRTETITYICTEKGRFTLPGSAIWWWNPQTETLQKISLKAVTFEVVANPFLQKESPAGRTRADASAFPWRWTALFLLLSALVFGLFFIYRAKKRPHDAKTEDREKELFMKFQKAAATHDAAATMQALIGWLDQSKISKSPATLERFCTLAGDPELKKQIAALETSLYATKHDRQWSGDLLAAAVGQARKNLKKQPSHTDQPTLPELNP